MPKPSPTLLLLVMLTLLGLGLRLLVWQWREFQPLGGDEQEYLAVALTLLRDRQYTELLFMRPPLYPIFLAGSIVLVDSLVQQLRLVQVLISTATIPLVYLLAHEVALSQRVARPRLVGLVAAGLAAANYTLAANANELLSETLFLFGLCAVFWLLLRAGRLQSWLVAGLAGLSLGALALVRSVALPLLPLGLLWLVLVGWYQTKQAGGRSWQTYLRPGLSFVLAALLVILPWTARNYLSYGGLILIDTTGAENLWLDNDPAGREAVKAQLFALGDDRLARQQLASQQGSAVILADPARFANKAWGELIKLFALEYSDDMLARPAIWVSPGEIAARLLLGDALWLLLVLVGSYRLVLALLTPPATPRSYTRFGSSPRPYAAAPLSQEERGGQSIWASYGFTALQCAGSSLPLSSSPTVGRGGTSRRGCAVLMPSDASGARIFCPPVNPATGGGRKGLPTKNTLTEGEPRGGSGKRAITAWPGLVWAWLQAPTWIFAAWCGYIALTAMIFHVELRYRLPLYPVLLSYAALALVDLARTQPVATRPGGRTRALRLPHLVASLVSLALLGLTLLHANYPALAWQLGPKHWHLAQAEAALARGDLAGAEQAAAAALARDQRSALARIALAQVAVRSGDPTTALALLDTAVRTIRDHPQAHVLRGDLRRSLGDQAGARTDLAYETASRQDLQTWLGQRLITPLPTRLPLGDGLDLGFGQGLHGLALTDDGFRWTTGHARVRLLAPAGSAQIHLHVASGRPAGSPAVPVTIKANGQVLGTLPVGPAWQTITLPLNLAAGKLVLELTSPTFRPREFDPASPDGRRLGVKLAWVALDGLP
ncbi:MAG: tetratricopeptide repeat protein [Oscillochloridaceae bacterium umkhey_bin13]